MDNLISYYLLNDNIFHKDIHLQILSIIDLMAI